MTMKRIKGIFHSRGVALQRILGHLLVLKFRCALGVHVVSDDLHPRLDLERVVFHLGFN